MTKREAAIVTAYTGFLIGSFNDAHKYFEELLGRPIFTHELSELADEISEKSKKDFLAIEVGDE